MDPNKIWTAVLSDIELKVSKAMFSAFFLKTRLNSLIDGKATVTISNPFIKEVIEARYSEIINQLIEKHTQKKTELIFKVDSTVKNDTTLTGPLFIKRELVGNEDLIRTSHLNPLYTFGNFAVSSSNQMAYAAARAVAQSPGKAYNPLFLYGGVGVGKTHLMQAIGLELFKKDNHANIIFCSGEEFTNEIIEAIRNKNTKRFKDKFRSASILLIDDIQFIAGKNAVQEEFFYTFNTIHRRGSQIVFTSDRPPSEIAKLEERLRSRFEGGLLIDIQSPDFELRTAIVLIKAKQRGVDLPMNIAQELALQVSDARRLEGSLIRLLTEAEVRKEPLSLTLIRKLFGHKIASVSQITSTTPANYLTAVSKYFRIKPTLLKGSNRSKPISFPRQILMYFLRIDLGLSLNEVGSFLGGRDHTTIMHGVEKISSLSNADEELRKTLLSIKGLVVS